LGECFLKSSKSRAIPYLEANGPPLDIDRYHRRH
jgi:hypothetical protein